MSARHTRNSLAPVEAQISDVIAQIGLVAGDLTTMREESIGFMTETRLRLESLERAMVSRAQRSDKIRTGTVMALIGASVSAGVAILVNAIV